ncbi:alpha-hydroxy-acid oxidizing protein [Rhodobacterales bacterium HKCCE3408]|nr:alpha-hydroxy-acid oxidizing protein [Rhodobacterales bacterium HKCCE3408]
MPRFVFEYLDSATGTEMGQRRNRAALDAIGFMPAVMRGEIAPELETQFLGQDYALPVIMAPIGMAGSIWPDAERSLARAAARHRIPYCQSTVAASRPEDTGPIAGPVGWFQHYPVRDLEVRRDMLDRIARAGYGTLVVTVDVPAESRRERQRRAHLDLPLRPTPGMIFQMATSPAWSLGVARHGPPEMKFCLDYVDRNAPEKFEHAGRLIRGYPDRDDLKELRELWQGPMIVKGVLDPDDAVWLVAQGVDGLWVSNHAGRQFEAGPAAITQLPLIRAAVGPDHPIIFDSGVAGGLDILRGLALGADMVALGKAWLFALAAFGETGPDHLVNILRADMAANMAMIGATRFDELPARRIDVDPA